MPSITFKSNGFEALNLYKLTETLEGDGANFQAREKLRKAIVEVWPELAEASESEEAEAQRMEKLKTERAFDISPAQQTALAEGFLRIVNDPNRKDGEKRPYIAMSKLCRFSIWLEKQMAKKEVKEFTESDEAVESDPETKAAA
jgi:hypothetical protein